MATIFDKITNFLGRAFKEAAATDFLRDYRHATELFVGNDFSLVPKSGYLFHVYFDVNPAVAYPQLLSEDKQTQIGMLVKEVELPKFSIDTKTYNSYNRPNVVQNKIKYDNVLITFRDDSMDLIRNFWFDYYSYYYADTYNTLETHRLENKYVQEIYGNYGYRLRQRSVDFKYLHAVRIYSLTHNQFTEYILINPTITSFRHSKHDYEEQASASMTNEMTIAYEGVLYNSGYIQSGEVKGFANLIYDATVSPLGRLGARRSIFGRGGLLNTASSIISDITNGNYLSAIFKAATARQTFKGVNIKKAAVNEIRSSLTIGATNAISGLITQQLRRPSPGGYSVISSRNIAGSVPASSGPFNLTSALTLAGAAAILSRSPSNRVVTNPVVQATTPNLTKTTPSFPSVPGAQATTAPSVILKASDTNVAQTSTNQQTIHASQRRLELAAAIKSLQNRMSQLGTEVSSTRKSLDNTTILIANLNNKLALARSVSSPQDVISSILQQIEAAALQKTDYELLLTRQQQDIASIQQQINQTVRERDAING